MRCRRYSCVERKMVVLTRERYPMVAGNGLLGESPVLPEGCT